MFCEVCGSKVNEQDEYCEVCGSKINKIQPVLQAVRQPAPQPVHYMNQAEKLEKKKRNKTNKPLIVVIIALAVIALLALSILIFVLKSPARKVIKEFEKGNNLEAIRIYEDEVEGSSIQEGISKVMLESFMGNLLKDEKVDTNDKIMTYHAIETLGIKKLEKQIEEDFVTIAKGVKNDLKNGKITEEAAAESAMLLSLVHPADEIMAEISDIDTSMINQADIINQYFSENAEGGSENYVTTENDINSQSAGTEAASTEAIEDPYTEDGVGNGAYYDNASLFKMYVNSNLPQTYPKAACTNSEGTISKPDQNWFNDCGIYSAYIKDLNNDGADEMLVFLTKEEESNLAGCKKYVMYVQLYNVVNDNVSLMDEKAVGPTYETESPYNYTSFASNQFSNQQFSISSVAVNNEIYIIFENRSKIAAFTDGSTSNFWAMKVEGDKINNCFSFTQTDGGTSDLRYTGFELENGNIVSNSYLFGCYGSDTTGMKYESLEAAVPGYFAEHGITISYSDSMDVASFIGDDICEDRILNVKFELKGSSGSSTFMCTPTDYTFVHE